MNRYYSESAPFNWLRSKLGIKKPVALRWGEWEKWDAELKKNNPVGFFLTETLPELLEKIPKNTIDHIDNVRIWVKNYVGGTHALTSNLKRGQWHEYDTRMLHCLFDSFVDFIEIETANHTIWCGGENVKKYKIPFIHRYRWLDWGKSLRIPEAGMEYLEWAKKLDQPDPETGEPVCTHQAKAAVEQMELYKWWKEVRPARKEAWVATGFRAFWDSMDTKYGRNSDWIGLGDSGKMTTEERAEYDRLHDLVEECEKKYDDEDEEYMIRLIKLRHSLWT
jgi:hypothetical protein